jgi:hypothetical protein
MYLCCISVKKNQHENSQIMCGKSYTKNTFLLNLTRETGILLNTKLCYTRGRRINGSARTFTKKIIIQSCVIPVEEE